MNINFFFDTIMSRELFYLIVGDKIGDGCTRDVYEHNLNENWVVKFECRDGLLQNAKEWHTWEALKDTKFAKWLAPCHYISQCSCILIQNKTVPLREHELPKMMPAFLSDFKQENYGLLKDKKGKLRVVCHDYGTNMLVTSRKGMKKANW